jgi:hypothetical protein
MEQDVALAKALNELIGLMHDWKCGDRRVRFGRGRWEESVPSERNCDYSKSRIS